MRYKVRTWGELAHYNGIVWIRCKGCRNKQIKFAADLCNQVGPHCLLRYARFRCNLCNGREVEAFPYLAGFTP